MKTTHAGLAALALAMAIPCTASRAAEPTTIRLYYVPGNWAQSFNGFETELSTVFTDKAVVSAEDYRGMLSRDGLPAMMVSCGSDRESVLFKEPANQLQERDYQGALVFRGDTDRATVTLSGTESEGTVVARLKSSAGRPAPDLIALARLVGGNGSFAVDYQRSGAEPVVHYRIAPAKVDAGVTGPGSRPDGAAAFEHACAAITAPAALARRPRS
ncbi:MAG TPA: hypothetical protein VHD15_13170 [Hyphomicrobiales bacterium]|nr:hypothetical protein [Hyphomicrobiales bacterium]